MDEPYKSIVKKTMFDRYQYMRQLYTCLFRDESDGEALVSTHFSSTSQLIMLYMMRLRALSFLQISSR
jgi:hypothetical protein